MLDEGMKLAVILPAAGLSKRFGKEGESKLTAKIGNKAVLVRAAELFAGRKQVKQIIVGVDPDNLEAFKFVWADKLKLMGAVIVAGGRKERWETVLNALAAVEKGVTHVAVHDAARPVADPAMIDRVFKAAESHPAVIPAVPIHATIKRLEAKPMETATGGDPLDSILGSAGKNAVPVRRVVETIPRESLWAVQTPQVFELGLLRRAYTQIAEGKFDPAGITDDAMLVEKLGEPVFAVEGDSLNIKITTPDDLAFASAVAALREGKSLTDTLGPKRQHPTWAQMADDV